MQNPHPTPTDEQTERVKQFIALHNEIDQHLQHLLNREDESSFIQLLRDYEKFNPYWRDGGDLRKYVKVRNAIVHGNTRSGEILAIPTQQVVDAMQKIRDRLIKDQKAFDLFRRDVACVAPDDSLTSVLENIRRHEYSQFPVYGGNGYEGLLTENGITRWLAKKGVSEISLVDFDESTVSEVLSLEEQRPNCEFVGRSAEMSLALEKFRKNRFLEAILITEKGRPTEKPIGIITRWDVIKVI